jgi:acyl-CoA synthetase (AMP-forming)/AMP-acid ligase II
MDREPTSLWRQLSEAGPLANRSLRSIDASVDLAALSHGSSLNAPLDKLRGASVLVLTEGQLRSALAMIELDGIARRLVICPLDVGPEHLPSIIRTAEIDTVVGDRDIGTGRFVASSTKIDPRPVIRRASERTEWILMTSGTTGEPKLVNHTLASLIAPMLGRGQIGTTHTVWSSFYDMRRYAGMQTFLRSMLCGGSMVLSDAHESVGDFLLRLGTAGVTHINGTPSHWRRALMSSSVRRMAPRYVRLPGEIADQAILDALRTAFPDAGLTHCYASTEAGIVFDVTDGLAGFPVEMIGRRGNVEVRLIDGSLRIKSDSTAVGYLGGIPMFEDDGFVDSGDMVDLRDGRYYFAGRRGGIINIGGQKVHPEEIEAVINRHPGVRMSLVTARRNPITGAVVVADVVAASDAPTEALKSEILEFCRDALARHKMPASIRFVPALEFSASGKLLRHA